MSSASGISALYSEFTDTLDSEFTDTLAEALAWRRLAETRSPPTFVNQTFGNQIEAIDLRPARQ